jgi:hypothetical protein
MFTTPTMLQRFSLEEVPIDKVERYEITIREN